MISNDGNTYDVFFIEELEIKQNKYIEISRLINKYNLLKEFYNNNIERYNFIAEGTYYLEQLNISKTISSKPFLLTNNAILINLDELYLNGYRKVEDIINLFTEELKSYLNTKSLDQSL